MTVALPSRCHGQATREAKARSRAVRHSTHFLHPISVSPGLGEEHGCRIPAELSIRKGIHLHRDMRAMRSGHASGHARHNTNLRKKKRNKNLKESGGETTAVLHRCSTCGTVATRRFNPLATGEIECPPTFALVSEPFGIQIRHISPFVMMPDVQVVLTEKSKQIPVHTAVYAPNASNARRRVSESKPLSPTNGSIHCVDTH